MYLDFNILPVFRWWLEQILKVFDLMKHIPVFSSSITLYHVFIAMAIISIIMYFVRLGMRTQNTIRWLDSNINFYDNMYTPRHSEGAHARGKYRYRPKHVSRR